VSEALLCLREDPNKMQLSELMFPKLEGVAYERSDTIPQRYARHFFENVDQPGDMTGVRSSIKLLAPVMIIDYRGLSFHLPSV
jgi:hypothetical protein